MSGSWRRVSRWSAWLVGAVSLTAGLVMVAPPAVADGHALRTSLSTPSPTPPGRDGVVTYSVRNAGLRAAEGILLNVSLPPHVTLDPDPHCRQTGRTGDGGTLISCNFSDAMGRLGLGQRREARTPFHLDGSAPRRALLGRMGALVVPLRRGVLTEPYTDLSGPSTAWAPVWTS